MPATTRKPDGSMRRVGIEIEFQGIPVEQLATLIATVLGGSINELSRSEYEVDVPGQGIYRIEVDYALLKQMAKDEASPDKPETKFPASLVIDTLDTVSAIIVPCEIVSPPLDMESVGEPMDQIVDAVRKAGASGTRASVIYAFGVHLNVEPTDMQPATIVSYLQAFVCLFEWIVWAGEVDLARRVSPYIDAFPADYENLIIDPGYQPDAAQLIADYLRFNSTRNRALDMLPMLSSIDEDTVQMAVQDKRVNARPAFHYRLANSCVDEPGWSIADPWNRWLKIEQLAADAAALAELCAEKRADNDRVLHKFDSQWRERVQAWIDRS